MAVSSVVEIVVDVVAITGTIFVFVEASDGMEDLADVMPFIGGLYSSSEVVVSPSDGLFVGLNILFLAYTSAHVHTSPSL